MRNRLSTVLCLALLSGAAATSSAQTTETDRRSPGPGPVVVTLDLRTGAIGSALPFDEPFVLKAEDKSNKVAGVALSIFEADEPFKVVRCGKASKPECEKESWKCVESEAQAATGSVHPRRAHSAREYPPVKCTLHRDVAWSLPPLQPGGGTSPPADFVLHVPALKADSHHQLLLLYRLGKPTSEDEEGLLARFERKAALVIAARYAGIDPEQAPFGSFRELQQYLREELAIMARDHGLEVIDDPDHPFLRWSDRGLTPDGLSPEESLKESFDKATTLGANELVTRQFRLQKILRPQCRKDLGVIEQARARIEVARAVDALEPALEKVVEPERVKSFLEKPLSNSCGSSRPAELEEEAAALSAVGAALQVAEETAGKIAGGEHFRKALQEAKDAASTLSATVGAIARNLRAVEEQAKRLAKSFSAFVAQTTVFARASTIGTFETRAKWQISGDFGVAWAPDVEEALPFLGTNFYVRPVNKQAPLPKLPWRRPLRRMSLALGLVLTDVGDDRTREALFATGDLSLLLGGGWRLTDSIRLGGGAVVFKELHPDPLVDDASITSSPYVSLAIDWDLKSLVQWFQKLWPGS